MRPRWVKPRLPPSPTTRARSSVASMRTASLLLSPASAFVSVEPLLKAGGIFKNKGRLVIWLTDDERRIPVLMKSKVMIGSVKVVLQEIKTGV